MNMHNFNFPNCSTVMIKPNRCGLQDQRLSERLLFPSRIAYTALPRAGVQAKAGREGVWPSSLLQKMKKAVSSSLPLTPHCLEEGS